MPSPVYSSLKRPGVRWSNLLTSRQQGCGWNCWPLVEVCTNSLWRVLQASLGNHWPYSLKNWCRRGGLMMWKSGAESPM